MKTWLPLLGMPLCLLFTAGCKLRGDGAADTNVSGLFRAEVATIGMDYLSQSPVVLVRSTGDGRTVPIWIGFAEAQAIARGLQKMDTPRPMTHDLALSLLEEAGASLEEIHITGLREGIFYASVQLRIPGKEDLVAVDSRPSDALALALRRNALIYLHPSLLEDAPDYLFVPPQAEEQVVQILGMTVVTLNRELRGRFGIEEDDHGVVITSSSGKALEKGLKAGDLIQRVGEKTVTTPVELLEAILEVETGGEVEIHFRRGREDLSVPLPVETEEPSRERIMI